VGNNADPAVGNNPDPRHLNFEDQSKVILMRKGSIIIAYLLMDAHFLGRGAVGVLKILVLRFFHFRRKALHIL